MEKQNYQNMLDRCIEAQERAGKAPSLLLHSCCAPCSSYVLEYLCSHFAVTLYYYNPNISPEHEYIKRLEEQKRLLSLLPVRYPVAFLAGDYRPEEFERAVTGLESEPEGGARCTVCYRMRAEAAARAARQLGCDYFTTTLSVSPHKNAVRLGQICAEVAEARGVEWLPSDFKKRGGYQRSIELSREYGLYRQDNCGCRYSNINLSPPENA